MCICKTMKAIIYYMIKNGLVQFLDSSCTAGYVPQTKNALSVDVPPQDQVSFIFMFLYFHYRASFLPNKLLS